jgi:cytochrome c oxidase cbb3-type subunit III
MPQASCSLVRGVSRRAASTFILIMAGMFTASAQQPPLAGATAGALQANLPTTSTPAQVHGTFLDVPINTFIPGAVPAPPQIGNPAESDAAAAERGMMAFNAFNCVGCHMGNGGGGMGPSLSEGNFIYGSEPQDIYLTIVQGRPHGMPAWGTVLPNNVVWDLVAYIRNLSIGPTSEWGKTVSAKSPAIEQVPAEISQTPNPWQQTEPFKNGQKP